MFGLFLVAILIVKFLEFFEVIDLFEVIIAVLNLIVAALRLIASLFVAVGAFLVYLIRRRGREKKS